MATPEFTATDIKKFDIKAQDCIALAWALGWTIKWQNVNRRVVILRHGAKSINVPQTNVNANRAQSWLKQIIRHSDDDALQRLVSGTDNMLDMPTEVQRIVGMAGIYMLPKLAELMDTQEESEMPQQQPLTQRVADAVPPKPEPPAQPKPEPPAPKTETTVEVRPYYANRGPTGVTYESDLIEVLVLPGGAEVFKCKRCTYVNENPKSVRSHVVSAHPGEYKAPSRGNTKSTDPPQPTPAEKKVGTDLFLHVVRHAMYGKSQPQARDILAALFALDFTDRADVAMLLLNGKQFEQLRTTAEEAITEANQRADKALAELAATQKQRDELMDEKQALRDLLFGGKGS